MPNDEDLNYRSPIGRISESIMEDSKPSSRDQADYSTLKSVQSVLENHVAKLSHDFNAFSILEDTPEIQAHDLIIQIKAKKEVEKILSDVLDSVRNAINEVDSTNKR